MNMRRLLVTSVIGTTIVAFLLLAESLADRGVYGWGNVYEVVGYLWMPGIAFAALFMSAGIHDGSGFIYLMVTFTAGFYALVGYFLATTFARHRLRRRPDVSPET